MFYLATFSPMILYCQNLATSFKSRSFLEWVVNYLLGYINPFRPDFTIVIFINYKPRIAAAILDL